MKRILLLILLLFTSCSWPGTYWVEIEQKVTTGHVLENDVDVTTYVWVRNWLGRYESLEWKSWNVDDRMWGQVTCSEVPSERQKQMNRALEVKAEVERRLKIWQKCKQS